MRRIRGARWRRGAALLAVLVATGTASASTSAVRPLWCTAAPTAGNNGQLQRTDGCDYFAFHGVSFEQLTVVRDRVHVISGWPFDGILVATFDEAGGKLRRVACYGRDVAKDAQDRLTPTGCEPAPEGLNGESYIQRSDFSPEHIVASPDGRYLYVASQSPYGAYPRIETLRRSSAGSLVFQQCVTPSDAPETSTCARVKEFDGGAGELAISPDGEHLYTVFGNGMVTFQRQPDGDLVPLGCTPMYQTACGDRAGRRQLDGSSHPIVVSPDSKYVYVLDHRVPPNGFDRAGVTVYARTEARPGLRLVQHFLLPSRTEGARNLVITPDGKSLFVAPLQRIFELARDRTSGKLSLKRCLGSREAGRVKWCASARFEFGPVVDNDWGRLAISRDGRMLALAHATVFIFRRTPSSGALKQVGCVPHAPIAQTFRGLIGCSKAWKPFNWYTTHFAPDRTLAFSGDGKRLFVANAGSITVIGL